ncbi:hypothetical protein [Bacillus sp. N1-1]|uniref:hypothetical protein n=1 Tax=Bacillus sp. N1-1 TaxID=2682541 RepID=UPI001316B3C7|nr:hypothetical protein [Bacillus sp. N1-1]QHA90529.1 hypothetical protein GNK04_03280 [Bacillus sp. N1-1]
MNTVFVFGCTSEATRGPAHCSWIYEKRRRAFRNEDIGVLELEHALRVLVKERNIAVSASRSWI